MENRQCTYTPAECVSRERGILWYVLLTALTLKNSAGPERKQASCQSNFLISPPRPRRQKKGDETKEHGRVSDHLASNGCQISHTTPKFLHGHNTYVRTCT